MAANPPLTVYIKVEDDEYTYFEDSVSIGGLFAVNSQERTFQDTLQLTISTFNPNFGGSAGDPLQTMTIDVSCRDSSAISLLTRYGALQLTAFETPEQGYQSVFESLAMSYGVVNDGPFSALVQQFDISTTLFGDSSLVSEPGIELESGANQTFTFQTLRLNMYQIGSQTFQNLVSTAGVGLVSGVGCVATAMLDFTVGGNVEIQVRGSEYDEDEKEEEYSLSNDPPDEPYYDSSIRESNYDPLLHRGNLHL
jgi:hypothetical protein